jgi:elongation factor Ts
MFQRTALTTFRSLRPRLAQQRAMIQTRAFSAPSLPKLIQQLRKATGAPMMECKKALNAVDNDYEKATAWLRKNGSAKAASKLAGRDASEGLVGISLSQGDGKGSIVKISSETDFASRSSDFQRLVEIVSIGALKESNVDDLMSVETDGKTVKDSLDDAILAIRENLQISSVETIVASSNDSVLAYYVHGKVVNESNTGTAAAMVELLAKNSKLSEEEISEVGKKLAMHIVAAKPTYQAPEDVPDDDVEKEKAILMDQMADSGKPEEILEKIVLGRMRKYYEGVCLAEQAHMLEEGNPKVSKFLDTLGLELVKFKSTFIS